MIVVMNAATAPMLLPPPSNAKVLSRMAFTKVVLAIPNIMSFMAPTGNMTETNSRVMKTA